MGIHLCEQSHLVNGHHEWSVTSDFLMLLYQRCYEFTQLYRLKMVISEIDFPHKFSALLPSFNLARNQDGAPGSENEHETEERNGNSWNLGD